MSDLMSILLIGLKGIQLISFFSSDNAAFLDTQNYWHTIPIPENCFISKNSDSRPIGNLINIFGSLTVIVGWGPVRNGPP